MHPIRTADIDKTVRQLGPRAKLIAGGLADGDPQGEARSAE
ncbi:MAG TPA: hypothetical protein VHW71_03220 [Steroidobacteraceae bacterium]|nr:hypothetical protein [Steroidobacteraceae bacterium]